MIVFLNGAFGIGKTTVARELVSRVPGSLLFDPELVGMSLQRLARLGGSDVDDFRDLAAWRSLTVAGLRVARWRWDTIIVPMAISNLSYLAELRAAVRRFDPVVLHFCLVATTDIVHSRLRLRGQITHNPEYEPAAL